MKMLVYSRNVWMLNGTDEILRCWKEILGRSRDIGIQLEHWMRRVGEVVTGPWQQRGRSARPWWNCNLPTFHHDRESFFTSRKTERFHLSHTFHLYNILRSTVFNLRVLFFRHFSKTVRDISKVHGWLNSPSTLYQMWINTNTDFCALFESD